jgi:hypothetical protein
MTTWEETFGGYIGIANKFLCTTCLNPIFRGSSGHFGQKLILNKVAPSNGVKDEQGHQIAFQCQDCSGREAIVAPVVHPNGEIVDHINISELQDAQDKKEITRVAGDYDNRQEMAKINTQYKPSKVVEEIQEERAQRLADSHRKFEEEEDE